MTDREHTLILGGISAAAAQFDEDSEEWNKLVTVLMNMGNRWGINPMDVAAVSVELMHEHSGKGDVQ